MEVYSLGRGKYFFFSPTETQRLSNSVGQLAQHSREQHCTVGMATASLLSPGLASVHHKPEKEKEEEEEEREREREREKKEGGREERTRRAGIRLKISAISLIC